MDSFVAIGFAVVAAFVVLVFGALLQVAQMWYVYGLWPNWSNQ